MEAVRTLLEEQPMVALFLTIALGYLVGEINIKGFSLGVGAVLFVALAVGWIAPKSVPPAAIGTLGLALFLYAVGIQYGRDFFRGLASAEGRRANLLALIGVLLAGAVTLAFIGGQLKLGYALGLFAGSGTSTPTLQAAIQTLGNDDPAMGYSAAYPFGVAGPILFLQLAFSILKPRIDAPAVAGQELYEIVIRNPAVVGKRIAEVMATLPAGVQLVAVRAEHRNKPASPQIVLQDGDVVLAVSSSKHSLETTRTLLGEATTGQITADRRDLDYLRVFVSRPNLVGTTVGDLALPDAVHATVMHVRRGDSDLLGQPDLVLEFGDRVGLLTDRASFPALRNYFGDSIKGTAEFSYISIGIGMALGFLVGAIHVPVPGVGKIAIGVAGVLVVALFLGYLRRTGGINWMLPISANLVLRNLGLTLFLAQVGMSSGPKFAATVAQTGFLFIGLGAIILFALVLPILVLGLYVFRMPFDEVAGIVAGACGNAAILAFANKLVPTDRPDIAYAMIFPGMTIVKILFVDIVPAFYGG
jgi:putative transport protein